MKMYLHKTPYILQRLYPKRIWNYPATDKVVYLTFDDGPTKELGPWILETLEVFNAKATFFCVGENITKLREFTKKILDQGHEISNHTFNHLNGWETDVSSYIENIEKCQLELENLNSVNKLFRPPYGKLTSKQARILVEKGYKIIMWDMLSGDFDKNLSGDDCLKQLKKHTKPGSLVVFHDNIKSESILKKVLPPYLSYFAEMGYSFKSCPW